MSCEQIDELLAAYSLSALDDETMPEVRRHLADCRKHDVALAELQDVAQRLPLAAEEREPSAELRSRLLRAFDAEAGAPRPASTPSQERPARVVPFVRRPAFAWLAAAALFLAVIGLTTWNVVLQTGGGKDEGWTVSAKLTGTGVSGHFWYLDREQLAVMSMDNMPPIGSGHVYQAWGIWNGKQPVSLGVIPDEHTVAINADLGGAATFAVTEEPAGGSNQPTSAPLAVAQLD